MLCSLFASSLLFAPAPPTHEDARAALIEASDAVLRADKHAAIEELERAIAELARFPEQLADDPELRAALVDARVRLAWLYLTTKQPIRAQRSMDEALRAANGPIEGLRPYGPPLNELHEARHRLLERAGRARLQVDCRVPCEVILDGRPHDDPERGLYLGAHLLRVTSVDGLSPPLQLEFELGPEGLRLDYGPSSASPPPPSAHTSPASTQPAASTDASLPRSALPDAQKAEHRALLPIWAEGAGIAAGLALLVTGGVLLGLDGKCHGDLDAAVDGPSSCPKIYAHQDLAYPLLGLGAATAIGFGAVLGVDRVRAGRSEGHQVSLGWALRF